MAYEKIAKLQSNLVIGAKQSLRAMRNDEVSDVYIAKNADDDITKRVANLALTLNIPCHLVDSKEKLGIVCGIDVAASAVAIKQ